MSEFKLVPTLDRVFIVCDEIETKTKSGVVIPVSGQEETTRGMVVAAGPECRTAFAGKRVVFLKAHGVEMEEGGVKMRIMREGDTLGYEDEHASQGDNWGVLEAICYAKPEHVWTTEHMARLKELFLLIKK